LGWGACLSGWIKRMLLVETLGRERQYACLVGKDYWDAVADAGDQGRTDQSARLTFLALCALLFTGITTDVSQRTASQNIFCKVGGKRGGTYASMC